MGLAATLAHADPVALERVLTNLLDNAIRHSHTRVEVAAAPGRVDVADDGLGFSPDDLPHAFEPLFRADKARRWLATPGSASRSPAGWRAHTAATCTPPTPPPAVRASP